MLILNATEKIDLHSHLLPGMDDGAVNLAESEEMLAWYSSHGFSTVVATPHLESTDSEIWLTQFDVSLAAVQKLAIPIGITVVCGAEVRLTPDLRREDVRSLAGTNYVLVDFPNGSWPFYAEDVLFGLQLWGFAPILAHPERYGWESDAVKMADALVKRGVVLQVTLASLVGHFGTRIRRCAHELVEEGLVHVLATDAHDSTGRMGSADAALAWLTKKYGDEAVAKLIYHNPGRILEGLDVESMSVPKRPFKMFAALIQRFVQ